MTLLFPAVLTAGAVLWTVLLLAAAPALGQDAFGTLAAYLYEACRHICHQRPERSFSLADAQLPVCARCFGLYVSGAAGAIAGWAGVPRPLSRARLVLALAAVPTGLTWALEAAGLAGFSNAARALAALPLGAAGGWVFVQMLRYDAESHGREIHDSRTPARLG